MPQLQQWLKLFIIGCHGDFTLFTWNRGASELEYSKIPNKIQLIYLDLFHFQINNALYDKKWIMPFSVVGSRASLVGSAVVVANNVAIYQATKMCNRFYMFSIHLIYHSKSLFSHVTVFLLNMRKVCAVDVECVPDLMHVCADEWRSRSTGV